MNMPEWLERASPSFLATYLTREASARKGGLFVRHMCRCFPDVFRDPAGLAALDAADGFESGEVSEEDYRTAVHAAELAAADAEAAWRESRTVLGSGVGQDVNLQRMYLAAALLHHVASGGHYPGFLELFKYAASGRHGATGPRFSAKPWARTMRRLFLEHFGDTQNPTPIDPAWLTSTVVALARGIYEERAFDRMPILADALQDAGCDNADILGHCRNRNATHVRGCWVVDMLLGKS